MKEMSGELWEAGRRGSHHTGCLGRLFRGSDGAACPRPLLSCPHCPGPCLNAPLHALPTGTACWLDAQNQRGPPHQHLDITLIRPLLINLLNFSKPQFVHW